MECLKQFLTYSLANLSSLISQISDIRERHYEKMGIGSSYLFRLDDGYVVSIAIVILVLSSMCLFRVLYIWHAVAGIIVPMCVLSF
jgi:hypothetical protein